MTRLKLIDQSPKFLPVNLSRQLLPGAFEHALNHLLDHEIDLSGFDERFLPLGAITESRYEAWMKSSRSED